MAKFTIPKLSMMPFVNNLNPTIYLSQYDNYRESIMAINDKKLLIPDYINVYDTTSNNELMKQIIVNSYPIKGTTLETRDMNQQWEAFYRTIYISLRQKIIKYLSHHKALASIDTNQRLRSIDFRVACIDKIDKIDDKLPKDSHAILHHTRDDILGKIINKLELENGIFIKTHIAYIDPKIRKRATFETIIRTNIKFANAIICTNHDSTDQTQIATTMINSLIALHADGYILQHIPLIASTAVLSVIILYSMCFDKVKLLHMFADDKLYIYGHYYARALNEDQKIHLAKYCMMIDGNPNVALFSQDFMRSNDILKLSDLLVSINYELYDWRYNYYHKLISTYNKLHKSLSNDLFDSHASHVIAEAFEDKTKEWMQGVDFNLFLE